MSELIPIILIIFLGIFSLWAYLSLRHSKSEYFRLDSSLQHERYNSRLVVDFMHALEKSYDEDGKVSEISKDILFRSILHTAIRGTRAMSACIFRLKKNDRFVPIAQSGLFPLLEGYPSQYKNASRLDVIRAHFADYSYPKSSPVFAGAIDNACATLVRHFPLKEGNFIPEDAPTRPKDVIIVPVYFSGKLVAAIAIANPRHRGNFTPSEIKLADILAQQAGMAMQMRNLFAVQAEKMRLDSELGIAASIQKLLLPKYIPQAHSIDIATTYRPAQTIGGDLYDVFDLGGGRIAAIVADVSGHGVSAALLMAICRTNFHQIARTSISAADLLRRLAHCMAKSFSRGKFLTIVCAFLDTQRNTLSVARGGHERPILLSNNDPETGSPLKEPTLEFLDSTGLAIGLAKPEVFDATITEITRPCFRNDVLILYTDGLTEECNAQGEEFGSARLAQAILETHGESAQRINDVVIEKVSAFSGKKDFADDLTLVALRVT